MKCWNIFFAPAGYIGGILAQMTEAEAVQWVGEETVFKLTALCFGKGEKSFTLYEDDGVSLAYEDEKYNTVVLTQNAKGCVDVARSGTEPPRYEALEQDPVYLPRVPQAEGI
jgi:hypothetical protein